MSTCMTTRCADEGMRLIVQVFDLKLPPPLPALRQDVELGRDRAEGRVGADLALERQQLVVRSRVGVDHRRRHVVRDGPDAVPFPYHEAGARRPAT